MPRSKKLSEEMRTAAKEKILSAALQLFIEKGIASTGIKAIAASAGVSTGLLYHYFKTKDEIFVTLVRQVMDMQDQFAETLLEQDPATFLKQWIDFVLTDIANNGEFTRMMNLLTCAFLEDKDFPGRAEILESSRNFTIRLEAFILKGQTEGVFKKGNPAAMAQLLLIMLMGLSDWRIDPEDKLTLPTTEMITAYLLI